MKSIHNSKSDMDVQGGVKFFTISDLVIILGWSMPTVKKLFNHPEFPASNFGKQKVVEKNALIKFFSIRRDKTTDLYWNRLKE